MIIDFQKIIDDYVRWVKDNTSFRSVVEGSMGVITTPFLGNDNDHLDIYVVKQGDRLLLTDDGNTLQDLKMSGVDLTSGQTSPKRDKILKMILRSFGVSVGDEGQLQIEASIGNVAQKKHYLLQAILSVNDMCLLSQENVVSLFKEDVESFFRANNFVFSKDIKISGKTGFDHNVDFLVPASMSRPERLIKVLNTPKKDSIMSVIFAFEDIAENREGKMLDYVIYNDADDRNISQESLLALDNYGIRHVGWEDRKILVDELAMG